MTYHQYYTALNIAITLRQNNLLEQYKLMKGYKGYLDHQQLKIYNQLTSDLYVLMDKSKDIYSLIINDGVGFDDKIDPSRLSFPMEKFDS